MADRFDTSEQPLPGDEFTIRREPREEVRRSEPVPVSDGKPDYRTPKTAQEKQFDELVVEGVIPKGSTFVETEDKSSVTFIPPAPVGGAGPRQTPGRFELPEATVSRQFSIGDKEITEGEFTSYRAANPEEQLAFLKQKDMAPQSAIFIGKDTQGNIQYRIPETREQLREAVAKENERVTQQAGKIEERTAAKPAASWLDRPLQKGDIAKEYQHLYFDERGRSLPGTEYTTLRQSRDAVISMIPVAGTVYFWNEMGTTGKVVSVATDALVFLSFTKVGGSAVKLAGRLAKDERGYVVLTRVQPQLAPQVAKQGARRVITIERADLDLPIAKPSRVNWDDIADAIKAGERKASYDASEEAWIKYRESISKTKTKATTKAPTPVSKADSTIAKDVWAKADKEIARIKAIESQKNAASIVARARADEAMIQAAAARSLAAIPARGASSIDVSRQLMTQAIASDPQSAIEAFQKMSTAQQTRVLTQLAPAVAQALKTGNMTAVKTAAMTDLNTDAMTETVLKTITENKGATKEQLSEKVSQALKPQTAVKTSTGVGSGGGKPPPRKSGESKTGKPKPRIGGSGMAEEETPAGDFTGAIGWKQGALKGKPVYNVVKRPYAEQGDLVTTVGNVPAGATIIKGKGSAKATAKLLTGKGPSKPFAVDVGAQDAIIKPEGNRRVSLRFKPDPYGRTRNPIRVGVPKPKRQTGRRVGPYIIRGGGIRRA